MVRDKLTEDLRKLAKALGLKAKDVSVEHPAEVSHGDFSTNVAMQMGGNPIKNAEKIVSELKKSSELSELVEKVEIAKPGFINFWLSKEALGEELRRALKEGERYGTSKEGRGKTLVIDYSSPNIAKPFGIGHLRSTIIGQAIYNLYRFLGWRTIGDNHLGDWGTQFGALLAQIKKLKIKDQNDKSKLKNLTVSDLEELYVEFNKEAQNRPELWDEARMWFKKLEAGDEEAKRIWERLKKTSLEEFERIYKILDVKIDHAYGESFYEKMMPAVIDECMKKGIAAQDKGALIIKYPGDELPPGIIKKSDGATTYLTRDLATVKFRLKKWKPDLIVYEVGIEQELHFRQLFRAVELLGWTKETQFVHVKHGLYLSPTGTKFSTRRGQTIKLEDVLEEAIGRAQKIIEASETGRGLSQKEKERVAKAVGVGAIKYFDLSHHPSSNIIFSWEKIFQLEGNSAPYLQYTFARTQSVLKKSKITPRKGTSANQNLKSQFKIQNYPINTEEEAILRHFYKFPEVVREAAENFAPNLLSNFLFELAQKYNGFYNQHRILDNDFRLALNTVVGNILKSGLGLLGIEAPERM